MAKVTPTSARTFMALKDSVVKGIEDTFPIETNNRIMRVSNVFVDSSKTDPLDYKAQKEVKIKGKDYVAPVYADIEIVDKETGEVIDAKSKFRIMDIPVLTDRHSFILGGNEYSVDKQLRMKPGIYTREKENGELESQFNLAKGGGRGFKMWLNPEDGIFKLKIGTANPPLYPILKALGMDDSSIKGAWGDSLFALNQSKTFKSSDKDIMRAYKAIFMKDAKGIAEAQTELRDFFDKTILSSETTQRTLGKGFDKVEPETLLLTSKRLLKVSRGEEEPDDRDSLIYKHIYDTPDLIEANIAANKRKVQYDIKRILDKKNKVTEVISKDMMNKPVRSFFVQGSVANSAEQTNPTTILSNMTKVTSLGEGAIGDMNAITESMRMVNTSHAGVLDPVATPESDRIGINLHLALGADIANKELRTYIKNPKTGKSGVAYIKDLFDKRVAFPDQYKDGKPKSDQITIMHQGKISQVPSSDVDAVLVSPKQMLGYSSNLVPFMGNVQGNRAFMANKMLAQAIPLKYREEPLIQTKAPSGGTFEQFVGKMFSTTADVNGTVKEVTYDSITVADDTGKTTEYPLYNNFPLNNKSFVHSEPLVKTGDKVKSGDTLADTVYTKNGTLSIGTNLRVGILPFKDNTFEDGYVISETASKKLTSEHLREMSVQVGREDVMDLKAFKAHYPTAITGPMMSKLDPDGVVRRGVIVEPGDVIIAHLQKTEAMPEDAKLGKLSKKLVKGYRNNAQIWDKETTGKVVDVFKDGHNIKVFIRTEEPMQIGDKIVNRHGAKGIVSAVIPDAEMPADKDGKPIEVAVSPSAIPGRINPSQVLETAASKVALKLGKPLKIDNFSEINSVKEVKKLLDDNGLVDKEELVDPTTGQSLGKVMVGNQYYLKLMHQVSKKINARGAGPNYDIDLQPSKGGHGSAQAMDRLTWNSMVAHGARENLYEMTAYKAEQNPELWRNIKLGYPLPAPKTPFVFNKLIGYLAAGGVNVKKDGSKMYLMPITDKEILERSNGEIEDAKVVISKNLRPVQDGLFDEVKTGGLSGTKWTHIKLAEPILNPVMENAAMSLLDITKKQLDSIIEGNTYYNPTTKELTSEPVGFTAGKALESMLGSIDVEKDYDDLKSKAVGLTGQGLNKANKKLRFLRALRLTGSSAKDAYLIHNVPVLPPKFRPMYPMADGSLNHAPINYLYRDLIMVNKQLKELDFLDDDMKTELRRDMYKAVKATQGIGDPLVQRGEKKIIGAIELIKGAQPKEGFFQSVVFSKNQDLSGRSTITPSTEMSPDEMMMPKDMAWKLYQPFIIKELTKMGHKPLDASVMVNNKDPRAELALQKVSQERPVWLNRAPSLHRFSILAMQPKLYEGKSIKIHPLVVGGYTADFDGDTMAVHVPISHKAIEEAKNFLPTRVLEHAADNRVMLSPGHDIMTGMFYLTRTGGKDLSAQRKYTTIDEAMKDYKSKSIEIYDNVMIGGIKTTIGTELVRAELPPDILIPEGGLNKGTIKGFLKELSKKGPDTFRDVMDKLSKLAAKYNIYSSISIGLEDLEPDYENRDKIIKEVQGKLKNAKTDDERRTIISGMLPKFHASVNDYLAAKPDNALSQLMRANGKPSFDQFKQLISTPFAVSDEKGNAVPLITTKSFSEGLPISEYWTTTYGSRSGMIQKRLATADPGYFAKQIISVTIDNVVSMEDCGTTKGVATSMEDKGDIIGRYEAGTNILIDEDRCTSLLKSGVKKLTLRSPLTCEAKEGTCSKCYGLRENGQPAKIGDNVGALAGQFFTEPTTQGSMKAFHTGAVLGSGAQVAGGLDRLRQLTLVPNYLKDKATLAKTSGTISRIEDNPAGGKNVYIGEDKHLVGVRNILKVKEGDEVQQGDALTDGPVKPQELLSLKGIDSTQKYLVDSMKDTFKGMGVSMNRKLIETVVRSATNSTTIDDPGDHPYYVPGDIAPLTEIRSWNSNTQNELQVEDAVGAELATGSGPYRAGTVLDVDKIKALKTLGVTKVVVKSSPIKHSPSIVAVDQLARMGGDWLAKLNTDYLEKIIVQGAQTRDKTELSSYNPTGPYVLATGFGKGEKGKY